MILTSSSVLDPKVVISETTTPTDTHHNRPAMRHRVEHLHLKRLHHPLRVRPTLMLLMVAIKTTYRCGTPPWQHSNNNKVAQVKVSNDKALLKVTVTWLVSGLILLLDDPRLRADLPAYVRHFRCIARLPLASIVNAVTFAKTDSRAEISKHCSSLVCDSHKHRRDVDRFAVALSSCCHDKMDSPTCTPFITTRLRTIACVIDVAETPTLECSS